MRQTDEDGLPIGLQLVAPAGGDGRSSGSRPSSNGSARPHAECGYALPVDLETLELAGGGSLEFCRSGPEDADDLLVFHVGSPSAAVVFPNVTSAAAARGVRTATYSRPGYGGSTRRPGRVFGDEAANTAALADHFGASTFLVAGWSGGGPAALACAALLPDRVRSCASLAGLSPREEVGDVWFDWWNEEDREELRTLATSSPEPFVPEYEEGAKMFGSFTADDVVNFPGSPEADREAMTRSPEFAEALADSMRRAVATGSMGGSTTRWRSHGPGGSGCRTSASRSRSARAIRTTSRASSTAGGSPSTSPERAPRSSPGTATGRSWSPSTT
jgi:pimeloyl-ACP methyl ester carboxylesterase